MDAIITSYTCRKLRENSETVQHIIGTCSALTQGRYIHCRNQVTDIVHRELTIKWATNVVLQTIVTVRV